MLFGSLFFLTVFLPVALGGHWALQLAADAAARRRGGVPSAVPANAWLLFANAFFCAFGDPGALALLAVSGWANRAVALRGRPQHEKTDAFSIRHPPMPPGRWAKIFSPFDALKGFHDAIAAAAAENARGGARDAPPEAEWDDWDGI